MDYRKLLAVGLAALSIGSTSLAAPAAIDFNTATPAVEPARDGLPRNLTGKIDARKLRRAEWAIAPGLGTTILDMAGMSDEQITILGKPEVSQAQMVRYINERNPKPKLNCSVRELVNFYYQEGEAEGVRPDVALCQAIKETGCFAYGGDVSPKQNNFCGLGATGNKEPGLSFATPKLGAKAHIQHLLAYATTRRPSGQIVDARYEVLRRNRPDVYGKINNWTGLNGVWAVPGKHYGQDILNMWHTVKNSISSEEALANANTAVRRNGGDAKVWNQRGAIYFEQGKYKEALADFEKALSIDKKFAEAYYNRALTYQKLDKIKLALHDYDSAIKISPDMVPAYYNRACMELAKNDNKRAVRDFDAVLKLDAFNANAMNNRAVALARQKKYEEAWQAFQQILDSSPNYQAAMDNRQLIYNARKEEKKKK